MPLFVLVLLLFFHLGVFPGGLGLSPIYLLPSNLVFCGIVSFLADYITRVYPDGTLILFP